MNANVIIGGIVVLLLGLGAYFFLYQSNQFSATQPPADTSENADDTPMPVEPDGGIGNEATSSAEADTGFEPKEVIGQSDGEHDIVAYHYGNLESGDTELLFIGGVHAGYSGNTVVVAEELMNHLDKNPDVIPENVVVTVIPVLNPDGLQAVYDTTDKLAAADITSGAATVEGRFNGNKVDLNRNFDCQWQAEGTWQSRTVSGGSEPFSEPEARAIRDYVETHDIAGAVVWYSAAGGVYSSSCSGDVAAETKTLTNLYATAAGYKPFEEFDFYEITGDMVNWFAKIDIPAISVLLTNHTNPEWEKNRKGIEAMLNYYAD
jgi:hypothetical protein